MTRDELMWGAGFMALLGWLGLIACTLTAALGANTWDVSAGPMILCFMLAVVMTVIFLDTWRNDRG